MGGEIVEIVNEAWPFVSAAVGGYGAAVLKASEDSAAEATVSWGRRMLQRAFGRGQPPEALAALAADPGDPDLQAALRVALRKVLAADEMLAGQVRDMLAEAVAAGAGRVDVSNVISNSTIHGANVQAGTVGGDVTVGRE
jgi:hypothetical protein